MFQKFRIFLVSNAIALLEIYFFERYASNFYSNRRLLKYNLESSFNIILQGFYQT